VIRSADKAISRQICSISSVHVTFSALLESPGKQLSARSDRAGVSFPNAALKPAGTSLAAFSEAAGADVAGCALTRENPSESILAVCQLHR
jgi:hypothetical protein